MQIITESAAPVAQPAERGAWLWPVSGATGEIAALDGLRAVAVLMTMLVHIIQPVYYHPAAAGSRTIGVITVTETAWRLGGTGVQLFFTLSGFLLFLPYARVLLCGKKMPSARKFYIRRALRILPAYWLSLALILLFFAPPAHLYDILLHVFLIHDWRTDTWGSINGPYWTMAVESHYYLLLPPIAAALVAAAGRVRKTRLVTLVEALAFGSVVYAGFVFVAEPLPTLALHVLIFEVVGYLTVFCGGMGCSLLYVAVTESDGWGKAGRIRRLARWAGPLGLGALALVVAINYGGRAAGLNSSAYFVYDTGHPFYWLCTNFLLTIGYSGILLAVVLGWRSWARVLAHPALRFLGVISYSLYIWNEIFDTHIFAPFAQRFHSDLLALLFEVGAICLFTIPFCYGFYMLVERPFIAARRAQH